MNKAQIIADESKYVAQTYMRPDLVLVRGEGVYLYDSEGFRYLDLMGGIAVTALGHSDPQWAEAVSDQASLLTHVSNLFYTEPQIRLARQLVENSFADRVFYCNSGSEANETALKFARKYAREHSPDRVRTKIVAFTGSFHGRTMGALSATARSKYRQPFEPLVPDVYFAAFNDQESATALIDDETCAVIVEPLQGEGGVNPATQEFLGLLRSLCDRYNALLIFDEVQCGLGRTGTLWAYEGYGVRPDIMTLAKPLAGGLPIGAALMRESVSQVMDPGDHGSTFAGGPLVCRAAEVVFERINRPEMLTAVGQKGEYLRMAIRQINSPLVREVRGRGLLIGVELACEARPLLKAARDRGLLVISAGDNVVRLCPPLIISYDQIDEAVSVLEESMSALEVAI